MRLTKMLLAVLTALALAACEGQPREPQALAGAAQQSQALVGKAERQGLVARMEPAGGQAGPLVGAAQQGLGGAAQPAAKP